jgi:DNA topoisomerase-1
MTATAPGATRDTRRHSPQGHNHQRASDAAPASPADPIASAEAAGLRYVGDSVPGIRRVPAGKGFRYVGPDGKRVRDADTLRRIRSLVIPPAWTDVWICPAANGHLQATGRDARGRKQHRYHTRWREVRDETKYHRMVAFARALPRLRRRIGKHLNLPGLPREKVLATVVRLLEGTLIRVGNEEYVKQNHSFGLTTLRDGHVDVEGSRIAFHFRGKSGIEHAVDLQDRRLARVVQACQDLPGQELFQWVDEDGQQHVVDSADVNEYLHQVGGDAFTAKDFRTWACTVLAARALAEFETFDSQAQARRNVVRAIEAVAKRLGNTRAVCRKCYVHPAVVDAYLDGTLLQTLRQRVEGEIKGRLAGLRPEEGAVLAFLQERLRREARGRRAGAIRTATH